MTRLVLALLVAVLIPGAAFAQGASVERGTQLFRTTCAVPYCHGPEGTQGRAPKLTGHTHSLNSMFKVITWGIPGTGMPEFTTRLKSEEIADIVAYVMTMRGAGPAPAAVAAPRPITPEARDGRALFFDNSRQQACGTCHEADGWGVGAGPELKAVAELRRVPQSQVRTARPAGESPFPAVIAELTDTRVRVYDLSGPLPVLRTFRAGQLATTPGATSPGATWRHEDATRTYSDADIRQIANFIQWATGVH